MAQLVARFVRIEEARGSNPLTSTQHQAPCAFSGRPRRFVISTAGSANNHGIEVDRTARTLETSYGSHRPEIQLHELPLVGMP